MSMSDVIQDGSQSDDVRASAESNADTQYPPAPNPSSDPGVIPRINATELVEDTRLPPEGDFAVATLDPILALKLLSRGVQVLSDLTGDVPATPPVSRPSTPRLVDDHAPRSRTSSRPSTPSRVPSDDLKRGTMSGMPIGSPEAHPSELKTVDEAAIRAQYDAIARKFFSKKAPPITIQDYLLRLHRYCPMSTAVYLAAATYIQRLALEEKTVPITSRTVHRLLLASLRTAMKALEDLNYPHSRFAGVGGVSEKELAKLEISLCYLLNFELKVDERILYEKARALQQLSLNKFRLPGPAVQLRLPIRRSPIAQPEPFQAPAG